MAFIQRVLLPASLDGDDAWQLREIARLDRAASLEATGDEDAAGSAHSHGESLRPSASWEVNYYVALANEGSRQVLGWASLRMPQRDNVRDGHIGVYVAPERRGQGIGTALHERVMADMRAAGRDLARMSSVHPTVASGPRTIASPSGAGQVPADAPGVRFLMRAGYRLGLVALVSRLDLPIAGSALTDLRRSAQAAAGADYRAVQWIGRCPDEYLEGAARLNTALTEDAPGGEASFEAQVWDAERMRDYEARAEALGNTGFSSAAIHVPSGELVAYTILEVSGTHPQSANQFATVVHRAHRGHRLGLLVKATNLQVLSQAAPHVRRVHTGNAWENTHMIAVNEALGFQPSGVEGAWRRDL